MGYEDRVGEAFRRIGRSYFEEGRKIAAERYETSLGNLRFPASSTRRICGRGFARDGADRRCRSQEAEG